MGAQRAPIPIGMHIMSALDLLTERLAQSTRRRATGAATAPAKVAARTLRSIAATQHRDAMTAEAERVHSERTEGLSSALARVSQYRLLLANVPDSAAYAEALALAESDRDRLFGLPILPSDIRPNGRFARNVRDHLSRHSSHIRHGSMLATTAGADDIVSEALALCYVGLTHEDGSPRFPLVSVDSAEWVTGREPVMVPTLGALYRACRRAYWNELSRYRAMLSGRVTITSLDALSAEDIRATEALSSFGLATVDPALLFSDAPLTLAADYWESVATRRPTSDDSTLADALNVRDAADAQRAEREHAYAVHADRMARASSAHPFGMPTDDANAALVDSATAAVVAESGLTVAAEALGVTEMTITRRLESIRIRRTPDGRDVLARIASDKRPKRTTLTQRLSARHGRDVTVSRDGTIATEARTVRVPIGTTHAPRVIRSVVAHGMPTLATGIPNWEAGDHGPKRDHWAYLSAVSAAAHERAESIVANTLPDRSHTGALIAPPVPTSDAVSARIAARRAAVRSERIAFGNAATARRLRFLTIARAVRTGAVTVAA